MQTTFALHTLGCKLNFSESSTLSRQLQNQGYVSKSIDELADIYILNTCSVTDNADKECKQIIRSLHKKNPAAFIVVTGCYAQLNPQEIAALEGVDLVLGASEKFNLTEHIQTLTKQQTAQVHGCEIDSVEDFKSAFSYQDRTRAFLKIQDGCNYNCSYCTIPLARGKSRSDTMENILNNVQTLVSKGIQEIVLTGVNLGDYEFEQTNFTSVVQQLSALEVSPRFRISSIEPNLLTDEIIEIVRTSKNFMPHFHIPLQSGSNKILGLMRRRYQKELYAEKIQRIKQLIPHCGIGVDVIVGFPGETEEEFVECVDFIDNLDVSYLHVFTYSERNNTLAATFSDSIPMHVRKQRNKVLRNLSFKKSAHFYSQHIQTIRQVLFESKQNDNTIEGYTDNYIKIKTLYQQGLENKLVDWQII